MGDDPALGPVGAAEVVVVGAGEVVVVGVCARSEPSFTQLPSLFAVTADVTRCGTPPTMQVAGVAAAAMPEPSVIPLRQDTRRDHVQYPTPTHAHTPALPIPRPQVRPATD